jgi:hypothetical protein
VTGPRGETEPLSHASSRSRMLRRRALSVAGCGTRGLARALTVGGALGGHSRKNGSVRTCQRDCRSVVVAGGEAGEVEITLAESVVRSRAHRLPRWIVTRHVSLRVSRLMPPALNTNFTIIAQGTRHSSRGQLYGITSSARASGWAGQVASLINEDAARSPLICIVACARGKARQTRPRST